jgi:hypothetical protein
MTQTVTLVLTATAPVLSSPAGHGCAGLAFSLDVYVRGVCQPHFAFALPMVIEVHYTGQHEVREEELLLMWMDGERWRDAASTCTPPGVYVRDLQHNRLRVPVCHLTQFGLFGPPLGYLYLPALANEAEANRQ